MYIKTPKRYRGVQRRRVFSCQRFLLVGVLLLLIGLGAGIYQLRGVIQEPAVHMVETTIANAGNWQATQFAPTAPPTQDPSRTLINADNNWLRGNVSMAIDEYNEITRFAPNDVTVYVRLAEGYLTRGDNEAAVRAAEQAVTADPFSAEAWAVRALVYTWEGDFAEGVASAQQALAINPDDVEAQTYLAYAYWRGGLGDLAQRRASEAIDANPDWWGGYWVRGLVRENTLLDIPGALADFERSYSLAREQNPAMAGIAATGVARVLTRPEYGRGEDAVDLLEESLAIDADNTEVLFWLGSIFIRQIGDYARAQETLLDCTQVAPDKYDCWYLLGRARYAQGDQEGALQAFETAIDLDTPFARHYWWAAEAERVLGSCSEAARYLQTGYDMVSEGGLPADDEGNEALIADFESLLSTCRVTFVPANPTEAPAEPTPEATGDG